MLTGTVHNLVAFSHKNENVPVWNVHVLSHVRENIHMWKQNSACEIMKSGFHIFSHDCQFSHADIFARY